MEDERRASEAMDVTIRSQRNQLINLKREERLLNAQNETINRNIQQKQKERSKMSCFFSGSQVANLMNKVSANSLKRQRVIQEQVEEYRHALDLCCQTLHETRMDIEDLEGSTEEFLTIIQELRTKNKNLEVQLEKAVMFGGPHVDQPISKEEELGQLPDSYVEYSDVEDEQIAQAAEEEKAQVQTKSWWRRQFRKVVHGMGTFRLRLKRCQRVKRPKKTVARLINVQPVNSNMDIAMPPVSVGMPPVSV